VNFHNLATLNPRVATKILITCLFSGNQFVFFWHFQRFLLYFTRICNCVTGSDGLKHFYVEMNIRNSRIAVRMLYENNHAVTQQKCENTRLILLSLKLLSVAL
jgi:fatty-acid desaturase